MRHPVGRAAIPVLLVLGGASGVLALTPTHGDRPPRTDAVDVVALAQATEHAEWVPWLDDATGKPYRLVDPELVVAVAPEVAADFGNAPVEDGLTAFNDVQGSAVDVNVVVAPPDEIDADVVVVEVACLELEHGDEGRAMPHVVRTGVHAAWVDRARIEVCPGVGITSPRFVRHLLAHELAHVLGFGHLCEGPGCWPLERAVDPCEFMYPAVHPCQDLDAVRAALPMLYPA